MQNVSFQPETNDPMFCVIQCGSLSDLYEGKCIWSIVYSAQRAQCTACTVYSAQRTVYTQWTAYSVQCTVNSANAVEELCTVYSVRTVYSAVEALSPKLQPLSTIDWCGVSDLSLAPHIYHGLYTNTNTHRNTNTHTNTNAHKYTIHIIVNHWLKWSDPSLTAHASMLVCSAIAQPWIAQSSHRNTNTNRNTNRNTHINTNTQFAPCVPLWLMRCVWSQSGRTYIMDCTQKHIQIQIHTFFCMILFHTVLLKANKHKNHLFIAKNNQMNFGTFYFDSLSSRHMEY